LPVTPPYPSQTFDFIIYICGFCARFDFLIFMFWLCILFFRTWVGARFPRPFGPVSLRCRFRSFLLLLYSRGFLLSSSNSYCFTLPFPITVFAPVDPLRFAPRSAYLYFSSFLMSDKGFFIFYSYPLLFETAVCP